MDLRKAVKDKIALLGGKEASRFFGVSIGTISNWSTGKTAPSIDAVEKILGEEAFRIVSAPREEVHMWEGRKLHILLPVYRSFCPDTHYTLFANYARYGPEKIAMTMEKRTVIHESRNILTHKGMKSDAEWFMMIDDDMILPCGNAGIINGRYGANIPEPGASANAISRLMAHPKDARIVGALYFGRHAYGLAQCSIGFEDKDVSELLRRHNKYQNLTPVGWVGTGCIKIHRSVFDELKQAIDGGKWPECKPINELMWYGFWNPIRAGVGEDVSFGRRCADIGITSWVDPVLECLHVGERFYGSTNTTNPI